MSSSSSIKVGFTRHATDKFKVFQKHGLKISKRFVARTVRKPELEDNESRKPLKIAISELDSEHYLRVIYKQKGDIRKVITFYPARRERYEGKI